MQEYVKQQSTQIMTGEEELETEEEMEEIVRKQEDEEDWAYDNFINN